MLYDVAIIGGGIVGLATAYHLSETHRNRKIIVLEKESVVARHQTGRNSGVIHSGIYYTPGSLKAENCRLGRLALVEFCDRHGVAHEICGKVIVAVEERELPHLRRILQRGLENSISCETIGPDRLAELEPHCAGLEAIYVPDAGIVDFRGVAEKLASLISSNGHEVRTGARVVGLMATDGVVAVETLGGEVMARTVVNCAGLYSDKIARMSGVEPGVQIVPFRGEYYELRPEARHLCRNLIYPVPDPAYPFLGVHFTRMFDGRVECGPSAVLAFAREGYRFSDVSWSEAIEYVRYVGFRRMAAAHWKRGIVEVAHSLSTRYYLRSLRRLIPDIRQDDLLPAPAGVRAQALRPDGSMLDDFLILKSDRFINVCNAPSPAATAALNIGRLVGEEAAARL